MLERSEIVSRYGSWRFKSSSSCQSSAKDMYALKIAVNGIHGNSHRFRQSNHACTVLHVSSASGRLVVLVVDELPEGDERIPVSLQRVSPLELASSLKKRQPRWSRMHDENYSASLHLPREMQIHVARMLDLKTLKNLSVTSKKIRSETVHLRDAQTYSSRLTE
jgi:hypothetical protein